jgi:hypothetical protein
MGESLKKCDEFGILGVDGTVILKLILKGIGWKGMD